MCCPKIVKLLWETMQAWIKDNAMRLSAALSLYTILSLAPLLVITLKVLSVFWLGHHGASEQLSQQVSSLVGTQGAAIITPIIQNGGAHGAGRTATLISSIVLLFSATGVFIELQDSMNTIWGVTTKPNKKLLGFIRKRVLSLGMVFGVGFLVLLAILIGGVVSGVLGNISQNRRWSAFLIPATVPSLVAFLLFSATYKFLPNVKVQWKNVWLGAGIAAALFTVGRLGLVLYFRYGSTTAYGVAGSVMALLLWVYYSAFSLYFGAEFTKIWTLHHGGGKVEVDSFAEQTGREG